LDDAKAAFAKNDFVGARLHLMNALQDDSANAEANILFARTAIELGDYEGAEASLNKLSGQNAYAEQVQALKARIYLLSQKYKEALALAQKPSGEFAAQLSWVKISALLALGRVDEAKAALDDGLAAHATDPDLMALNGNYYIAQGNLAEAEAIAQRMLKIASAEFQAHIFAGQVATLKGEPAQANEHFAKAVAIRPQNITGLTLLGLNYAESGDIAKARKIFAQTQALAPNNPMNLARLAQLEYDEGNLDKAFQLVQSAKGAVETLPAGMKLSGMIDARRGSHRQAVDKLQRYLAEHPDEPEAVAMLAKSLEATGASAEAQRLLAANPLAAKHANGNAAAGAQPTSELKSADAALRSKDYAKASAIYDRLIAAGHDRNVVVLNNAAVAQMELGKLDQAIRLGRQALAVAPTDPIVLDTLGWALVQSGDRESGMAMIAAAYKAMPGNAEIADHYRQAKAL
jgi:tetratricopeptide (TPR) repeat protein